MPRNVRNFWIELSVDGKKSKIATGPVSRIGGFNVEISMRSQGQIITPIKIIGEADGERVILHVLATTRDRRGSVAKNIFALVRPR